MGISRAADGGRRLSIESAGPSRSMRWALLLLLVAAITFVLAAGIAAADPEPPPAPGPAPGTSASPAPGPSTGPNATPAPKPTEPKPGLTPPATDDAAAEKKKTDDFNKRVEAYKKNQANGGVLSAFEVTDRDGNPVSAYRIFSDTGDWKDWDLKIEAFLVDGLFLGTKWLVSFACFLIAWSLSFKLAGLLLKPALSVSNALYTNTVVQLGLPSLFLTFAGITAAWHLMFGNRARGWGEAAASLVISALAITTLAAPPQLLLSENDGAIATTRALAIEVAALVVHNQGDKATTVSSAEQGDHGWETPDAKRLARPITDELVDAFVVRPAELLSYGQTFDGDCAKKFRQSRINQAVFDQMVDEKMAEGKSAIKDLPGLGALLPDKVKNWMTDTTLDISSAAMVEEVKDNGPTKAFEQDCIKGNTKALKKASMDKVGGALFMFLGALLACLFITVVNASFLISQIWLALEAMIARVALAVGILPGPGRSWLWARGASILRSLVLMVVSVLALAVLIVVITAILNTPEKDLPGGLTVRFVVVDLLCIGAFIFRKRLAKATQNMALRARARIGAGPLGGAAPADLGQQPRRRHLGRALLLGGLALGTMAATGGTARGIGALSSMGRTRGAATLATRLVRGTGRLAAKTTAGTAKATGRAGMALARFGLKSTVGLPVYGPRAARAAMATASAVPGRVAGGVAELGQRVQQIHQQYTPPVSNFTGEYVHNLRSFGRLVRGRPGLGTYTPRHPAPAPSTGRRRAPVPRTAPAAFPSPQPPAPRRRPVPPRLAQPPASAAQAQLQQRLHRIRSRQHPPAPPPPTPTPPPARPARARPTPRRSTGRGGRP